MILFKDALIYDGTGLEPFHGDILVENDIIVKVENNIKPEEGWEIINLEGRSIAPGFIDAHSHNDWFAIKNDPQKYFEPFPVYPLVSKQYICQKLFLSVH